ncbi:MAG: hypothetical protein JKY19_14425 [Alcanivoracaceae bacterium]|nr:hypothetical protein [Alcanivoracaceae bacterium]
MSDNTIIIDNITIHLPNGWRGDPQLLARQVSQQIQKQAHKLHSAQQMQINLQGHYAGHANLIMPQLQKQLIHQGKRAKQAKRDNK